MCAEHVSDMEQLALELAIDESALGYSMPSSLHPSVLGSKDVES